jgi:hypothetical protein
MENWVLKIRNWECGMGKWGIKVLSDFQKVNYPSSLGVSFDQTGFSTYPTNIFWMKEEGRGLKDVDTAPQLKTGDL